MTYRFMKINITKYLFAVLLLSLAACTPSLPEKYETINELPSLYPDYIDVTIPCNIAPLT